MLSIQKILVLVAILWIVWTIFKFFDRRNSNLNDTYEDNVIFRISNSDDDKDDNELNNL